MRVWIPDRAINSLSGNIRIQWTFQYSTTRDSGFQNQDKSSEGRREERTRVLYVFNNLDFFYDSFFNKTQFHMQF